MLTLGTAAGYPDLTKPIISHLVKSIVNAKGTLKGLTIDESLFKASEKEVVEDLIVAAIRDAQEKSGDRAKEEMAKVTSGLNLPEGFKLPF